MIETEDILFREWECFERVTYKQNEIRISVSHRMEMVGTSRSGRYNSELLHRAETSEGAFLPQLVGL